MLQKLLKDTELKDVIVSRHVEPRYVDITRKIFFRKKTEKVQDGACAIYVVKRDYVYPILKVCVVCGDNVTAQDISVFDGVVDPEFWTNMNLSDQEKIETWREVKNLYETEQKRKQEPEYWKEKLEKETIQGRQKRLGFVDQVLAMLSNVSFLQEWNVRYVHEQGHEGDVGAPRGISHDIHANGYKFSLLVSNDTLTIRKDDKNEELVFAIPEIKECQVEKFMSIYYKLDDLRSQKLELAYEKEQASRIANQRRAEYERQKAVNQQQQTKCDAFLKSMARGM